MLDLLVLQLDMPSKLFHEAHLMGWAAGENRAFVSDLFLDPLVINQPGDESAVGLVRNPKEGERYFALIKARRVNFDDPEETRNYYLKRVGDKQRLDEAGVDAFFDYVWLFNPKSPVEVPSAWEFVLGDAAGTLWKVK